MWRNDIEGVELAGLKEAYEELRRRAQRLIEENDRQGRDVRLGRIRLRDESGDVLFEGTLADAARLEIDGRVFLPSLLR